MCVAALAVATMFEPQDGQGKEVVLGGDSISASAGIAPNREVLELVGVIGEIAERGEVVDLLHLVRGRGDVVERAAVRAGEVLRAERVLSLAPHCLQG